MKEPTEEQTEVTYKDLIKDPLFYVPSVISQSYFRDHDGEDVDLSPKEIDYFYFLLFLYREQQLDQHPNLLIKKDGKHYINEKVKVKHVLIIDDFRCFLSHYDEVSDPGASNFEVLASTEACAVQSFRLTDAPVFGVQFHAEFSMQAALELFDIRAGKTPEAVPDAAAMRARAVDTLPEWQRMYARVLKRD